MTWVLLGIVAWFFLSLPLGVIVGHILRDRTSPCSCRKHAWDPYCTVHGTQVRA